MCLNYRHCSKWKGVKTVLLGIRNETENTDTTLIVRGFILFVTGFESDENPFNSNLFYREAKSLFDAKSTVADLRDVNDIADDIPPPTPREEKSNSRRASKDSYDSQEGRSVEEVYSLIREVVKKNYQGIERVCFCNIA